MNLSKRISIIDPSSTLALSALAKKMQALGIKVISFAAGEPDFDTPSYIKEKAKESIDGGWTKYTPVSGILELKEAICKKLTDENNLEYSPEEIIVSCGAKHSLYNAIQVICNDKDEVILPIPYWVSYLAQIRLANATPIFIKTFKENGYKIIPSQLQEAITSKTKLLILNTPNNPSGAVYSKEELEAIAKILVKQNIYCISDEIYEKIIYNNIEHISIASLNPEIKKLTIVINGFSKTYAMTGWRIGYAAGNKEIIKAMDTLQSHSTSNPVSFCQKAAIVALESSEEIVKMVNEFTKRRDYIVEMLNSIQGISCCKPHGAFYVFPDISQLIGKKYNNKVITTSSIFAELLLQEVKVVVVAGKEFGMDDHLRFSYATSFENIIEGMNRFKEFVNKLN